jgi:hypothetical protein
MMKLVLCSRDHTMGIGRMSEIGYVMFAALAKREIKFPTSHKIKIYTKQHAYSTYSTTTTEDACSLLS